MLSLSFFLLRCGRVGNLGEGKYEVADQEYSSQNYIMQRQFLAGGAFQEQHVVDRCLLMEMAGRWEQKGGTLKLHYDLIRNRTSCHDSLPDFGRDSSELKIPLRNVGRGDFESLLAASDGKPEKWIKWLKVD